MTVIFIPPAGSSGGGGAPSGPAGGKLAGTYPNPDLNAASTDLSDSALLARLASPAFTGHPTGVTEAPATNSTRLGTTAYADAAVAAEALIARAAEGAAVLKANNLSDVASAATAYNNLATGRNIFNTWRLIREVINSSIGSSAAAGTYVCDPGGAILNATGANGGFQMFRLDPADWPAGPSGATPLIRIRANLFTNAVAPGTTITGGLYPITGFAGASGNLPTIASVGAATASVAFASQALSTQATSVSASVNFPAAGWFMLGVVLAGACAANSNEQIGVRLEVQQP